MKPDLNKLTLKAVLLEQKDNLVQALAAYQDLARAEPENTRWVQRIGEVQRKLGNKEAAVTALEEAARRFAERGNLPRAIALCKEILDLDPNHGATQSELARLHSVSGQAPAPSAGVSDAPATTRKARTAGSRPVEAGKPPPPPAATALGPRKAGPLPKVQTLPRRAGPAKKAPLRKVRTPPRKDSPDKKGPLPKVRTSPRAVISEKEGPLRKVRTLPRGACLDEVTLSDVFPDAHLQEGAGLGVYAVPLDEEPTAVSGEILLPRPMLEAAKTPTLQPRTTPLLSSLDEHALSALINKVTVRSFRPGEKIVVQGERSDSLYVLAEGEVTVYREGRPRLEMGRLQEGAFFGEIALLSRRPQSATVEAISAGLVLEITPEMVSDLIEDYPDVLKVLLRYFRERLIDTLVVTSPLFTAFADEDRKDLAARFTFLEAKPKTLIIPQGQRANGLYVLLAGHLTVGWREDGKRHRVVVSEPGSVFGQTSLLTRNPAPAGVWSRTKCWLLWLDRATFQEVIMTHPQVLAYLSELALQQPADKGQPPLI